MAKNSSSGAYILSRAGNNNARLWGSRAVAIEGARGFALDFSNNGKYILSSATKFRAELFDFGGEVQQYFVGHNHVVSSGAISSDNKFIVTGSSDKTAKIWNLDGTLIHTLRGHSKEVTSVYLVS